MADFDATQHLDRPRRSRVRATTAAIPNLGIVSSLEPRLVSPRDFA
jgi:hypothetical protein